MAFQSHLELPARARFLFHEKTSESSETDVLSGQLLLRVEKTPVAAAPAQAAALV